MVERDDGFRRLDEASPLDSGVRERRSVEELDTRREELAPRGVGRILDAGIDALRARFLPCFGACLLLWIVPAWLTAFRSPEVLARPYLDGDPTTYQWIHLGATFAHAAISALVQIVGSIVVAVILRGEFTGERTSLGEAAALVARRLLALIGCTILVGLMSIAGIVMCFLPYIYVLWRTSLGPITCALEGRDPIESIRRSFQLTKGTLWRWAGVMSVTAVLVWPLSAVAGGAAAPEVRDAALENLPVSAELYSVMLWIAATLFFAAATATASAITTAYYFDCRVRRDGIDLSERLDEIAAGRGARTIA